MAPELQLAQCLQLNVGPFLRSELSEISFLNFPNNLQLTYAPKVWCFRSAQCLIAGLKMGSINVSVLKAKHWTYEFKLGCELQS